MITYETRTTLWPTPNDPKECPACERPGYAPCDCYQCRTCEAPGVFGGEPDCDVCQSERATEQMGCAS